MSDVGIKVDAVAAEKQRKFRIQAAAFLGLVGGIGALFGFSHTLGKAKKSDSKVLQQQATRQTLILMDEGSTLALRALGWGTAYAFLGTGAFCYAFWKLSGANNFEEFRMKMGNTLPRISREEPPTSRTDFDSLTDLMKYLATWAKE